MTWTKLKCLIRGHRIKTTCPLGWHVQPCARCGEPRTFFSLGKPPSKETL